MENNEHIVSLNNNNIYLKQFKADVYLISTSFKQMIVLSMLSCLKQLNIIDIFSVYFLDTIKT